MKLQYTAALAVLIISGCGGTGSGPQGIVTTSDPSDPSKRYTSEILPPSSEITITNADIARCWKRAGIPSDLYKFMTPDEAAGVLPGGVFTEQNIVSFKTCLGVAPA